MKRTARCWRAGTTAGVVFALWLTAPGACSRKPLQMGGTGSGGSVAFDGGQDSVVATDGPPPDSIHPPPFDAPPDLGLDVPPLFDVRPDLGPDLPPPFDAPPDLGPDLSPDGPPFVGGRSFAVTSQIQRDGGIGTFPSGHAFTIVLDGDRREAIIGADGEGWVYPFEPLADGSLRVAGSVRFRLFGSCPGSSVMYNDLRVAVDASGGLTGTGQGQVTVISGDVGSTAAATMALTGVADRQPPRMTLSGDASDPFASFTVSSSEPLPPSTIVMLRAAGGETIELSRGGFTGTFVTVFQDPPQALRYATQYSFVAGVITDFAGNTESAATGINTWTFMTRARPPLAAEDGFEGVAATTFGGVPVLSGAGAPTIAGATSLYVAPVTSFGVTQPPLALRLQVAPGDSQLRFSFRTVTTGPGAGFSYGVTFTLGSEGGTFIVPTLPGDPPGQQTTATIGGTQVYLGPIGMATFGLPGNVTSEVVLARTHRPINTCGAPLPSIAGIIIDDVRLE